MKLKRDYFGLQYMYHAGYDPNAFVNVFEHLQALEKKKPGALAKAFSTHPQTADRIQKSQEEIATVLPPREQYVENTPEFIEIKATCRSRGTPQAGGCKSEQSNSEANYYRQARRQ